MILMIKPHLYQFVLVDTLLTHESTLFCENEGGALYFLYLNLAISKMEPDDPVVVILRLRQFLLKRVSHEHQVGQLKCNTLDFH